MADLAEIQALIEAALPGAAVEILDEGGGDHLRAIAVSTCCFNAGSAAMSPG